MSEWVLFCVFFGSFIIMLSLSIRYMVQRRNDRNRRAALIAPFTVSRSNAQVMQGAGAYQVQPGARIYQTGTAPAYVTYPVHMNQAQAGYPIMTTQGTYLTYPINNTGVYQNQMGGEPTHLVQMNPPSYDQVVRPGEYQKQQGQTPNQATTNL